MEGTVSFGRVVGTAAATILVGGAVAVSMVRGSVLHLRQCDVWLAERLANDEAAAQLVLADGWKHASAEHYRRRFGDNRICIAMRQVIHNIELFRPEVEKRQQRHWFLRLYVDEPPSGTEYWEVIQKRWDFTTWDHEIVPLKPHDIRDILESAQYKQ
jgi:hypothetical protein